MAHCAGAAGALPSVRKYPPPLAASLDSRPTHWSVQTYRWKRTGGRWIRISQPEHHSGRLSRNSSRACCSHCAAGVAIMLHSLSDGCLPASGAVAKMGMHRWVCYGPEPRSASLGLPFDCTFSPTLSLGHPAMCLLLTAQGSVLLPAEGSVTAAAGAGRSGSAVVLFL